MLGPKENVKVSAIDDRLGFIPIVPGHDLVHTDAEVAQGLLDDPRKDREPWPVWVSDHTQLQVLPLAVGTLSRLRIQSPAGSVKKLGGLGGLGGLVEKWRFRREEAPRWIPPRQAFAHLLTGNGNVKSLPHPYVLDWG